MSLNESLFPLDVRPHTVGLGMGEIGVKYQLVASDGVIICHMDYVPRYIQELNLEVKKLQERVASYEVQEEKQISKEH